MNGFYEILREYFKRNGFDKIANLLDKSMSTVYRWVEEPSGCDLPAKYIPILARITKDDSLIAWLCAQSSGYFVRLYKDGQINKHSMLVKLAELTKNFSELLKTSSTAIEDGLIDESETQEILYDVNQLIKILGQLKFDLENKK